MLELRTISGITALYDEVLRFRKSAANFISNSQQEYRKMLGLTTEVGPFFSWTDNYERMGSGREAWAISFTPDMPQYIQLQMSINIVGKVPAID